MGDEACGTFSDTFRISQTYTQKHSTNVQQIIINYYSSPKIGCGVIECLISNNDAREDLLASVHGLIKFVLTSVVVIKGSISRTMSRSFLKNRIVTPALGNGGPDPIEDMTKD